MSSRTLTVILIFDNFQASLFCPGWGTTSSGGSTSNVLLEVDVQVNFSSTNISQFLPPPFNKEITITITIR